MTILLIVFAIIVVLAVLSVAWRWLSRRVQFPCPTWLAWGLEHPFMVWVLGTASTLDRLGLRPGQRVIEIGCGPGRLLLPAARRVLPGGEAVGLDIQPGMIERLEARARAQGVTNVKGIVADATTVHLPPESFDVALITLTLGEIPRQEEALRRVFDGLKPSGTLSITELFPDPHFVPQRAVRRVAEKAGFRHQKTIGNRLYFTASFLKPTGSGVG